METSTSLTECHNPEGSKVTDAMNSRGSFKTSKRNPADGGSLRFFVVGHPDELRDKQEMRKNRKHVMHDYLEKEKHRPDSTDARVNGCGLARKKRKPMVMLGDATSVNPSAPSHLFSTTSPAGSTLPGTLEECPSRPHTLNHPVRKRGSDSRGDEPHDSILNASKAVARKHHAPSRKKDLPLVAGINGGFRNARYLATQPEQVPFPSSRVGSKLNPFDTWPSFQDNQIDVSELKWSCSRRFGSKALAAYWVPTLLRARHAFLSTICISSAHDDIMRRAMREPSQRPRHESIERMRVREEVMRMVNESLEDPELRIADPTIVAVLHLLNSEIMGCDDRMMRAHQQGLHEMVLLRGGLNGLARNHQLASILTITMYLIATLREMSPHEDFVAYASKQRKGPLKTSEPVPESPVYCRPEGFLTVTKALAPGSKTHELLEDLRQLTNAFLSSDKASYLAASAFENAFAAQQNQMRVIALCDKVSASRPGIELDFPSMSERYMYEAIRLTAQVYAKAFEENVPISQAAATLRMTVTTPNSQDTLGSATAHSIFLNVPIHIQIKDALSRTDMADCWGHLAGVLFWITLVAGAAANPGDLSNEERVGEEEDARKWLAAIAVRCSVVLSFEHGGPMLETLKQMVAIEKALRWQPHAAWEGGLGGVVDGAAGSLAMTPEMEQRGFVDFASELEM